MDLARGPRTLASCKATVAVAVAIIVAITVTVAVIVSLAMVVAVVLESLWVGDQLEHPR